jgi:release factor glutamine methyltransferase
LNQDFLLNEPQIEILNQHLQFLLEKKPLAYILGNQEFYGLNFAVTPDVLIPRPDTELLVEQAIYWGRGQGKPIRMVDVGVGTGCILLSVLTHLPGSSGIGIDISFPAVHLARLNAKLHNKPQASFVIGDLVSPLFGSFDLLCANLPYIPTQDLGLLPHSRYEPMIALDGGSSGMDLIKRLLDQSKNLIKKTGLILLEIQFDQGIEVSEYARLIYPGSLVKVLKDYNHQDRIVQIEFLG